MKVGEETGKKHVFVAVLLARDREVRVEVRGMGGRQSKL